ncbi:MAG: poly-gamma-glutamate synthase PgsB [Acidimicrobiia bacterium]|nr:poly-gamma-glutamate synthase PgsB [Acidimicrobiia bacterium]MDX2466204.1 poly-gamma-glutamate synthase PgsB [Acidimicrobiia bacterium]
MASQLVFFSIAVIAALGMLLRWFGESWGHSKRLAMVPHRIHVNGIRGKSTVTRLIAGMLREADLVTVGKSTGSFAAVITPSGEDYPLHRNGSPTILEQINVVRDWVTPYVDAIVIECMAINPRYQKVSEERIIQSTIGIITNVREDHQDVLGETLPEIARSLMSSCPNNGILVTAEQDPELLDIMFSEARKRGTSLIVADPTKVRPEEVAAFDFISFEENIAIVLAIAELLDIPRHVAMAGMVKAPADPGVLRIERYQVAGKNLTWANLFAVNDRESMVAAAEKLRPYIGETTTTVGILNNRTDRQRRAIQFADIAVNDLSFDRLVTFGAYEDLVSNIVLRNGYPQGHLINLGEQRNPTIDTIIEEAVSKMPTDDVLLVGFVNIHTHQAEMMLDYFEKVADKDQRRGKKHLVAVA